MARGESQAARSVPELTTDLRGDRARPSSYRRLDPGVALRFSGSVHGIRDLRVRKRYFRIKMAAIVLAGANALVFRLAAGREVNRSAPATVTPMLARISGLTSIALWAPVIVAGRMMSYTMFSGP